VLRAIAVSVCVALPLVTLPLSFALNTTRSPDLIDPAATRAYLRADYAAIRAAGLDSAARRASLERYVRTLDGECHDIAPHVLGDASSTAISLAITDALVSQLLQSERASYIRFITTVGKLHWANGTLDRRVKEQLAGLKAELALRPPAVCQDLREWSAGGYRIVPTDAMRFLNVAQRVLGRPSLSLGLFAPYVRPNDRDLIRKVRRLAPLVAVRSSNALRHARAQLTIDLGT
jgi:hypothetical protein